MTTRLARPPITGGMGGGGFQGGDTAMTHPSAKTVEAIHALAKAVVEQMGGTYDESVGIHINWGESENYTEGFNDGYDCACNNDWAICKPEEDERIPESDPWRGAYVRGYEEGVDHRIAEVTDPEDAIGDYLYPPE